MRDHAAGIDRFDAHVHFGISDPAGLLATEEQALAALALVESGGVLFALGVSRTPRARSVRGEA